MIALAKMTEFELYSRYFVFNGFLEEPILTWVFKIDVPKINIMMSKLA